MAAAHSSDSTIQEYMIRVENKDVFIDLKRNRSGTYLKIAERTGGSRNTVLIPASGIQRLRAVLDEVALAITESPRLISRERKDRAAGDPEITARSIYVQGLTWDTEEDELLAHFAALGATGAHVLRTRRRGGGVPQSMGCGVVEFETRQAALHAVQVMPESVLKGRIIKCREDRMPGEDEVLETDDAALEGGGGAVGDIGGGGGATRVVYSGVGKHGPRALDPNKVFVTNLAWDTTEEDLAAMFSLVGEVRSGVVLHTKRGRALGTGTVEFADPEAAIAAVQQLNGQNLKGRVIVVREYYQ